MNPRGSRCALGGTLTGWTDLHRPSRRQRLALRTAYAELDPLVYSRYGTRQWAAPLPPPAWSSRTRSRCCPSPPSRRPPVRGLWSSCGTPVPSSPLPADGLDAGPGGAGPDRSAGPRPGPGAGSSGDAATDMGAFWAALHDLALPQIDSSGAVVLFHEDIAAGEHRGRTRPVLGVGLTDVPRRRATLGARTFRVRPPRPTRPACTTSSATPAQWRPAGVPGWSRRARRPGGHGRPDPGPAAPSGHRPLVALTCRAPDRRTACEGRRVSLGWCPRGAVGAPVCRDDEAPDQALLRCRRPGSDGSPADAGTTETRAWGKDCDRRENRTVEVADREGGPLSARPTVVYIAGSGRSGSTLLEQAADPGCDARPCQRGRAARPVPPGRRRRRRAVRLAASCSASARVLGTQVGAVAFGGWTPAIVHELAERQAGWRGSGGCRSSSPRGAHTPPPAEPPTSTCTGGCMPRSSRSPMPGWSSTRASGRPRRWRSAATSSTCGWSTSSATSAAWPTR